MTDHIFQRGGPTTNQWISRIFVHLQLGLYFATYLRVTKYTFRERVGVPDTEIICGRKIAQYTYLVHMFFVIWAFLKIGLHPKSSMLDFLPLTIHVGDSPFMETPIWHSFRKCKLTMFFLFFPTARGSDQVCQTLCIGLVEGIDYRNLDPPIWGLVKI